MRAPRRTRRGRRRRHDDERHTPTHRHTPQLSETAGLDHVVMARCIRRRPPACLRVVGCSVIGRPPSPYRRCNGAASFAVCCARRAVRGALRSVRFCACGLARCSRGRTHGCASRARGPPCTWSARRRSPPRPASRTWQRGEAGLDRGGGALVHSGPLCSTLLYSGRLTC